MTDSIHNSQMAKPARIDGPVVLIGYGSIGKGFLPLLDRHIDYDRARLIVVEPDEDKCKLLESSGVKCVRVKLTADNYREILTPLLTEGGGQGFCVNLSVDVSSLDVMKLVRS